MSNDNEQTTIKNSSHIKFKCPNCGVIPQDDVVFLCNTCEQEDMIFNGEMYVCPQCLMPGENFQCMICDSKEVEMIDTKKTKKKAK
jgi:hypothetical protein